MPDILIHRCKINLVRKGGWTWGPDPNKLLEGAIRILPELVARKLSQALGDEADGEITAPIAITVQAGISELFATSLAYLGDDSTGLHTTALEERLEQAISLALRREALIPNEVLNAPEQLQIEPQEEQENFSADILRGGAVLRLLLDWRNRGILSRQLESFSLAALAAWNRALLTYEQTSLSAAEKISQATIYDSVFSEAAELSGSPHDQCAVLRHRLIIALEVAVRLKLTPGDLTIQRALDDILPIDKVSADEVPPTMARQQRVEQISIAPAALRNNEVAVSSVLPFLLLGPLSQINYLNALAATFETARLLSDLPLFATGLAYKVLDTMSCGWRRSQAAGVAAASFAGIEEQVSEPVLVEFSRKIADHLSPLDSILSMALIEGHSPDQPLILHKPGPAKNCELLLLEAEGLFPVSFGSNLENLLPTLNRFGEPKLLIPSASASENLLKQLDANGFCFITDAPPTRGEHLRSLRGPQSQRYWTNDWTGKDVSLIRTASPLSYAGDEIDSLWQALVVQRPSIPLAADKALDRSLTLAACVALGVIGWQLWRESEIVTPLLALERFHDFGGSVRFDRRSIRVCLPLGMRYRDLFTHGLLNDISDVPWFGNRVLEFAGG